MLRLMKEAFPNLKENKHKTKTRESLIGVRHIIAVTLVDSLSGFNYLLKIPYEDNNNPMEDNRTLFLENSLVTHHFIHSVGGDA